MQKPTETHDDEAAVVRELKRLSALVEGLKGSRCGVLNQGGGGGGLPPVVVVPPAPAPSPTPGGAPATPVQPPTPAPVPAVPAGAADGRQGPRVGFPPRSLGRVEVKKG